MIFDFVDGGAEDERTLVANCKGYERLSFHPRALVDCSDVDISTRVLGRDVQSPVLLAPAGLARLVSRHGEIAAARAAGRMGTIFVLSMGASYSVEETAGEASGPIWLQLYLWRRREFVDALIDRAAAVNCHALCVTVDVPVIGSRERDLHNGMTIPPRVKLRTALDAGRRVRWLVDYMLGPRLTLGNIAGLDPSLGSKVVALGRYMNESLIYPGATWADFARVRERWTGPLAIKGIMTVADARRAVEEGADCIVVSNHGGRQLDGLVPSVEALPPIVEAVGDKAEVLLDGGIRRGSDVVKAIALGAKACLIGRPYMFGLAAGGENGVVRVLEILNSEVRRVLTLVGRPVLKELDPSLVTSRPG